MSPEVLAAVIGAVVGSLLTVLGQWVLDRGKSKNEATLSTALELLGFFSRILNRESPEHLPDDLPELRAEWAQRHRALYLLGLDDRRRTSIDATITAYLDSLEEFRSRPDRRPEVERRRELAKKEAFTLMRVLGL